MNAISRNKFILQTLFFKLIPCFNFIFCLQVLVKFTTLFQSFHHVVLGGEFDTSHSIEIASSVPSEFLLHSKAMSLRSIQSQLIWLMLPTLPSHGQKKLQVQMELHSMCSLKVQLVMVLLMIQRLEKPLRKLNFLVGCENLVTKFIFENVLVECEN